MLLLNKFCHITASLYTVFTGSQ